MEQLASLLLHSRTQAHAFHWGVNGVGALSAHLALGTYYDSIGGLVDGLVEAYQGKHGILKGYEPAERFDEYSKEGAIKYFKALATYVDRVYNKIPKEDTNIINQLDGFKDLIYTTIYKLENLQ